MAWLFPPENKIKEVFQLFKTITEIKVRIARYVYFRTNSQKLILTFTETQN
jgi:hypothetical protein